MSVCTVVGCYRLDLPDEESGEPFCWRHGEMWQGSPECRRARVATGPATAIRRTMLAAFATRVAAEERNGGGR